MRAIDNLWDEYQGEALWLRHDKGYPYANKKGQVRERRGFHRSAFNLQVDTAVDGLLHCRGPGSALVVTFTPSAARACAVMGETTPVRITL